MTKAEDENRKKGELNKKGAGNEKKMKEGEFMKSRTIENNISFFNQHHFISWVHI